MPPNSMSLRLIYQVLDITRPLLCSYLGQHQQLLLIWRFHLDAVCNRTLRFQIHPLVWTERWRYLATLKTSVPRPSVLLLWGAWQWAELRGCRSVCVEWLLVGVGRWVRCLCRDVGLLGRDLEVNMNTLLCNIFSYPGEWQSNKMRARKTPQQ